MADQTPAGGWVSLFSGGKDSSLSTYLALERGLDVRRVLTVHPQGDSYMYHVPVTSLAALAAESMGIPLVDVEPADFGAATASDAGNQGDAELEPLEAALRELESTLEGGLAGVVAGAIESEFQTSRIEGMCERLGCECFAPLWRREPHEIAQELFETGFEVLIVQVAADGLDDSWLGRPLDEAAFEELETLREQTGVHPLGEGGEFETLVVDGPHMDRRIDLEYEIEWDGMRGRIVLEDAWLE